MLLDGQAQRILKKYVEEIHIRNCPITVDDINRSESIYGKSVPLLQGKLTRKHPSSLGQNQPLPLTSCVMENHRNVHLYIDIFLCKWNVIFPYKIR